MEKARIRMIALALSLAVMLSGCAGTTVDTQNGVNDSSESSQDDAKTIKDLVYPRLATRELETFNILYSQRSEDFENLCNLVDPLLEVDVYGELAPCIAKEWGTEDGGLNWTFKLREGVKWVDVSFNEKAECTAQDFATGLEWILNFHKNDSNNTSMPIEMIKGAEDYYEYTKSLTAEEALSLKADDGSKFREMVGVETPDDYTVVYHCITDIPYFDTVATYSCLYPLSQAMVDELGGVDKVKSMNNQNMWYNGCYAITSYIQGNEKVFTKNPKYWDADAKLFDTVTFKMVESNDVAFQLYQAGELDYCVLTESNLKTINESTSNEFHDYLVPDVASKYSYQFHFNYNKNKEDGTPDTNWNTAIANKAFRLAWMYGLNLGEWYKRSNAITPMVCENNYYTMRGLVYNSKGVEYTELVRQELGLPKPNGEKMSRLDAGKFAEYKAQAIEELTALGVTFPVSIDYYISASSQTALDSANVLKQAFKDSLGDDFAVLNIKTYVSSVRKEVVNPHLHSIVINGWGADYGDPQNYLGQETYGNDNAYYSANYSYINQITEETKANKDLLAAYKEYTSLVEAANKITDDLDARYAAYAKAEAYMLENGLIVPCYYSVGWALARVDNTSRMNAMFGCQNDKMKNWRTNSDGYTTEQANVLSEAKTAGAKK
ncbi:MAG: ABC transporter substrate-binding protein [Clostridiaceae bacterium]|nr:ABC transporter substrate-binding protein [Clostridiaceae bacterium]